MGERPSNWDIGDDDLHEVVVFYEHWNPRRRPAVKQERPATIIILPVVHLQALAKPRRRVRARTTRT